MSIIEFRTKNEKQLEAIQYWIDDTTEQILYGGGKGGGKSFLGASLIFGDALIYPETHYFIARKELIDLRKFTIPTVHEVFKVWGLKFDDYASFNGQDNVFNLYNGSKVFLISCNEVPSDPLFERFGSMQMTKGWIEEGGEIAEKAKNNLWLSIGRWKNDTYGLKKKLLITANPKKGWMKRDFVDPHKSMSLDPRKKFVKALVTDNPYLGDDYVNTLREEKDEVTRQRLFYGDWDYAEDRNSLIDYNSLDDAFSNSIVKDNNKYLTVDVARLGKDRTVISYWDGLELYKVDMFDRQDTQETAKKVRFIAASERIPYSHIIIDEDGIGGGVVDNLFGVKGFVANSSPIPTASEIRAKLSQIKNNFTPRVNFRSLKSQCGFKLAELINEHRIAFKAGDRDTIIEELSALLKRKDIDGDGKLQIIPKEEVKQALGRSPDVGDTIIFRMWFELAKDALPAVAGREHIVTRQAQAMEANHKNFGSNSTK
jgi:phage terminase large subunit